MKSLHILKFVFLLSLLGMGFGVEGQLVYEWAKEIPESSYDICYRMAVDNNGNVYRTGLFQNTKDFDPGVGVYNLTSAGVWDIFISKLDSNGNFVWAKIIGGIDFDYANALALDSNGNVYISGKYQDTVDFDPGIGIHNLTCNAGGHNIFILKLDSAGNFIWVKSITSIKVFNSTSYPHGCMTIDNNNNIYIESCFKGVSDFDTGVGIYNLTSTATAFSFINPDLFILKLDSGGNFVWVKQIAGPDIELCNAIKVDNSGYVYSTGLFAGLADWDPGVGVYNLINSAGLAADGMFISKLDSNGNFVWANATTKFDFGSDIELEGNGNIYLTGSFHGTVDFDFGVGVYNLTSVGGADVCILKIDFNGNFIWAKSMGSTYDDSGNSIALSNDGNIYTTGTYGWTNLTIDLDPSIVVYDLTSNGRTDIFISILDTGGNFVGAKAIGGSDYDKAGIIEIDNANNIYISGTCGYLVDFNPPNAAYLNSSMGYYDIFVVKYSQCNVSTSSQSLSTCNQYLWNGNTYTTSGTYTYNTTTASGCDSVITLDLIIATVDVGVLQAGNVLTANTAGANYQWLDCGNGFVPLSGETGQVFTTGGYGSYAVSVSMNGCVDTSDCFMIVDVEKEVFGAGLEVYPNPNEGNFRVVISGEFASNIAVSICDVSGRLVYERLKLFDKGETVIETDLVAGFYILQLLDVQSGGRVVRRIVVE